MVNGKWLMRFAQGLWCFEALKRFKSCAGAQMENIDIVCYGKSESVFTYSPEGGRL